MKYSRPLDGLRGLAILLVIFFHFGFLGAGWIGVQVFFVLSGFLITSILLADKRQPAGPFFARFYWRRSLRIFPLYFGYLVLLALVYAILRAPAEFGERWQYLFSYTYNYALLLVPLRQSVSFTHFWSLAVEEQFYLIWPLIVFLLSARQLGRVVILLVIASPLIRYVAVVGARWYVPTHDQPGLYAYSPLPAQWDSLAVGAALAVYGSEWIQRPLRWLAAATAILLVAGFLNAGGWYGFAAGGTFGYPSFAIENYQHVWSYTLVNLWAGALLVAVLQPGRLGRVFENGLLTYSGQISYGLYVLHYPVLGLIKQAVTFQAYTVEGVVMFAIYVVVLYTVATASYRFFELKFLAYKDAALVSRGRSRVPADRA
jgi:peptidoglycan/LPS O-acetylase OafA/YrhL